METPVTEQTIALAAEIQGDLEQLKPNALLETLKGWVPGLMSFGYRLLAAIVILVIGIKLANIITKTLNRLMEKTAVEISVRKFLLSICKAVMYVIAALAAAEKIGIPSASVIALLGSAGIAIGLALQGSLANLAGGILILLMKPFGVGDYISGGGYEGTVEAIGIVYTTLLTVDNKKITIPNGSISNTTVVNVTALQKRRVDIEVGISYQSDIRKAKEVMEQIYRSQSQLLPGEEITIYVSDLADSAVIIGGRGWVKTEDYWTVRWAILEQIKLEYDKAGIEIPFRQLDVHICS